MSLIVAISTVSDGNMLMHEDKANKKVVSNRTAFLEKNGIDIEHTTRVNITYDRTDFKRYREVTSQNMSRGMYDDDIATADALITRERNHALFLPLADCVGVVLYDPDNQIIMLTHVGRHSLEQNGAYESVMHLKNNYDSNPRSLMVWLTPSPAKDKYPVHAFNNRSLKEVVFEQLRNAGIASTNITDNPADTTRDDRYFSHSEFLKGNKPTDGRHAIVVMLLT